jgi:hypothetical protein
VFFPAFSNCVPKPTFVSQTKTKTFMATETPTAPSAMLADAGAIDGVSSLMPEGIHVTAELLFKASPCTIPQWCVCNGRSGYTCLVDAAGEASNEAWMSCFQSAGIAEELTRRGPEVENEESHEEPREFGGILAELMDLYSQAGLHSPLGSYFHVGQIGSMVPVDRGFETRALYIMNTLGRVWQLQCQCATNSSTSGYTPEQRRAHLPLFRRLIKDAWRSAEQFLANLWGDTSYHPERAEIFKIINRGLLAIMDLFKMEDFAPCLLEEVATCLRMLDVTLPNKEEFQELTLSMVQVCQATIHTARRVMETCVDLRGRSAEECKTRLSYVPLKSLLPLVQFFQDKCASELLLRDHELVHPFSRALLQEDSLLRAFETLKEVTLEYMRRVLPEGRPEGTFSSALDSMYTWGLPTATLRDLYFS